MYLLHMYLLSEGFFYLFFYQTKRKEYRTLSENIYRAQTVMSNTAVKYIRGRLSELRFEWTVPVLDG